MLVGVLVSVAILMFMYWRLLSTQKDVEDPAAKLVPNEEVNSHRFLPATMSHTTPLNSQEMNDRIDDLNPHGNSSPLVRITYAGHEAALRSRFTSSGNEIHRTLSNGSDLATVSTVSKETINDLSSSKKGNGAPPQRNVLSVQSLQGEETLATRRTMMMWKTSAYLITIGMLVLFLVGLNMSWTAITAALALVVLDFKDTRQCLEKVSYALLIFFCGMFITVDGFNTTGIPTQAMGIDGALCQYRQSTRHSSSCRSDTCSLQRRFECTDR